MNKLFVFAGALAVAALVLPAGALATWYNVGTYEPDTVYDETGGFMYSDSDVDPAEGSQRVYFNAYPTEIDSSTNPNVGTLGSRVLVPGDRQYFATLGVWKDCNADGYIGIAESAAWSYSAALLSDASICPAGGRYNDGAWVTEYFAIGPGDDTATPTEIVDSESLVWGDFGLPGAGNSGTCPIYPLPHGTTSGTGAVIRYADCFAAKRITNTVNANDPTGQLAFDDGNNPQASDSLLNQHFPVNLFGNPTTCQGGLMQKDDVTPYSNPSCTESPPAAFTTYDCDSTEATDVMSPVGPLGVPDPLFLITDDGDFAITDEDGTIATLVAPSPSTDVNPTGSYAKGFNNTVDGAEGCGDSNDYGDAQDTGQFFLDQQNEGSLQNPEKFENDVFFNYFTGLTFSQLTDGDSDAVVSPNTGAGLGLNQGHQLTEGHWQAGVVYLTTPQLISRATLQPTPAIYMTFYAKIGSASAALGLSGLNAGVYGSEVCGTNFATDTNGNDGWNCDASKWTSSAVAGTPYQFRDIDCDDGTVARGTGVHASLVDLADGGCLDASA